MNDEDALAVLGLTLCLKKKNRKPRSVWCKKWLLRRNKYSHVNLLNELKFAPKDWHNYLRMDEETYLNLLALVTPFIKKKDTIMREAITPHERLTATLRFFVRRSQIVYLFYHCVSGSFCVYTFIYSQ